MLTSEEARMQSELDAVEQMTTAELIERYKEVHGHICRTRHRRYLIRKVAWRIGGSGSWMELRPSSLRPRLKGVYLALRS